MTEIASRSGLIMGLMLAGTALLAGCAAPVTRTVTSETTTTTAPVPPPPPAVSSTTTETVEPAPVKHYVRRTRQTNGDIVREETTETGSTTITPAAPPVQSTITRTTSETIAPH